MTGARQTEPYLICREETCAFTTANGVDIPVDDLVGRARSISDGAVKIGNILRQGDGRPARRHFLVWDHEGASK